MGNFFVEIISGGKSYNAGFKLIIDLDKIMAQIGYTSLPCKLQTGKSKFTKLYHLIKDTYYAMGKINNNSKVVYLYPDILYYDFLFPLLRLKKHTKIAIIIDINSLRNGNGTLLAKDKNYLLKFDELIVHTPAMKQLLIANGFAADNLKVINMFDYLINIPNKIERKYGNIVCYAGNLNKSEFLKELPLVNLQSVKFNLYGADSPNIPIGENILYMGKFEPGDLSNLEGNWGLVWDGNAINTCTGIFGKYLKVNLPHKTCLYTAAQLPIIIWEEAALAPFIKEHGIGITVKSITEISKSIGEVSQDEYATMFKNIKQLSHSLNNGEMLKKILGDNS
ncbi:MAG: hypothetical protein RR770_08220 [Bacteroidales bacterium]